MRNHHNYECVSFVQHANKGLNNELFFKAVLHMGFLMTVIAILHLLYCLYCTFLPTKVWNRCCKSYSLYDEVLFLYIHYPFEHRIGWCAQWVGSRTHAVLFCAAYIQFSAVWAFREKQEMNIYLLGCSLTLKVWDHESYHVMSFCTGTHVCCSRGVRPAVLFHRHHHCSKPHLRCDHWHVCWPEEWKTAQGGDPEDYLFHLR